MSDSADYDVPTYRGYPGPDRRGDYPRSCCGNGSKCEPWCECVFCAALSEATPAHCPTCGEPRGLSHLYSDCEAPQ